VRRDNLALICDQTKNPSRASWSGAVDLAARGKSAM
jgi:hypothetical protein